MTVTVKDLTEKITFDEIYSNEAALSREITSSDITRPGLEMSGYFDYFSPERIQLFGKKEHSYMMNQVGEERYDLLRKIFAPETPAVIVARNLDIPAEMYAAAKYRKVPLLHSKEPTSLLSGRIVSFLDERLAPRVSIHGVLMDVFGVGVLIQGASGIGKSETGLDLVRRGHRLVADDRVEVYRKDANTVVGEAPEILRNLIEIRGVGIIDVLTLFGASAVKDAMAIDLSVYLEKFDSEKAYDRLGSGTHDLELVDVKIPQLRIPVKTGRNLSVIIESAVTNFSARQMGFDSTKTFKERLNDLIERNSDDES